MGRMLVVNRRIQIPPEEFEFTYARSSGPGGQNVNKVNSKALLRWRIVGSPSLPDDVRQRFLAAHPRRVTKEGDVLISSQRYRDAPRNAEDCLNKLRELLTGVAQAPKVRRPTKPSRGSVVRRRQAKTVQSQKKQGRRPRLDEN